MKKVVVVAAVAICGSVFAGTFTWKGSGTSFSDCGNIRHSRRAEGRRPDGDGPCARPYRHRPIAFLPRFQGD